MCKAQQLWGEATHLPRVAVREVEVQDAIVPVQHGLQLQQVMQTVQLPHIGSLLLQALLHEALHGLAPRQAEPAQQLQAASHSALAVCQTACQRHGLGLPGAAREVWGVSGGPCQEQLWRFSHDMLLQTETHM